MLCKVYGNNLYSRLPLSTNLCLLYYITFSVNLTLNNVNFWHEKDSDKLVHFTVLTIMSAKEIAFVTLDFPSMQSLLVPLQKIYSRCRIVRQQCTAAAFKLSIQTISDNFKHFIRERNAIKGVFFMNSLIYIT